MSDQPAPDIAPEFRVVVNDDEQYSLQPSFATLPHGWRDAGMVGSEEACLAFIREHWTDMRPLSVRTAGSARPNAIRRGGATP